MSGGPIDPWNLKGTILVHVLERKGIPAEGLGGFHVSERNRSGEPEPIDSSWLLGLYAMLHIMITDRGILILLFISTLVNELQ